MTTEGRRDARAPEGAVSAPYHPLTHLPSLAFYWRTNSGVQEADTTVPEDTEAVTAWVDQVVSRTLTNVNSPTYDAVNSAFGEPTLSWTATAAQGMTAATAANWAFLHSACTIFMRLASRTGVAANAVALSSSDVAVGSKGITIRRESGTTAARLFVSDGTSFVVDINGGTLVADGNPDLLVARISATDCTLRLNGTQVAQVLNSSSPYTLPTGNPATPLAIGKRGTTTNQTWYGDMSMVAICNAALTDAQIDEMEAYEGV